MLGAINATVNRSTGFSPNRMILGRELMMPIDLMLGSDGEELEDGILSGPILRRACWRHIKKQGKYWKGSKGDIKCIMI